MTKRQQIPERHADIVGPLDVDSALLALLIGAMNANEHVSPEEGARAHHLIWSMGRFRHKSGEAVDRAIDGMRQLVERHGASPVVDAAARAMPARLRQSAYAVVTDLVLADGKIDRAERRFLDDLGTKLGLERNATRNIVDVMLIKNRA